MAIAFVQDETGVSGAVYTTTRTFGSSTTNGNAIVVVVANYGGGTGHTVSDNKGNTYNLVAQSLGSQAKLSIYVALNISGGASHQVTVLQTPTSSYQALTILEYSGVATAAAVDDDSSGGASSTTPSTGTVAVNQAGTLIVGGFTHEGTTYSFTPTSGNAREGFESAAATAPIFVADLLDQSSGAAIAWTGSNGPAWVAAGVSLKPGGAVPADPTNLAVANVTTTQADLSWDTSDDEDGTYLEIDTVNTFDSPDLQQIDVTADSTETVLLEPGTTYYWRVQTYNAEGASAWVNGSSFATDALVSAPTVTTATPSGVTTTTATLGGNVTSAGGATVTERGVVYNTTGTPTTSDTKLAIASGVGAFDDIATGLTPGTLYYVRAYAINSVGTAYGSQETFTTDEDITTPTVTTSVASSVTTTTAVLGGEVMDDGGATVTESGIVWNTTGSPTIADNKWPIASGVGAFDDLVVGLPSGTTIYFAAYGTNSEGTGYGSEEQFDTEEAPSGGGTSIVVLGIKAATLIANESGEVYATVDPRREYIACHMGHNGSDDPDTAMVAVGVGAPVAGVDYSESNNKCVLPSESSVRIAPMVDGLPDGLPARIYFTSEAGSAPVINIIPGRRS